MDIVELKASYLGLQVFRQRNFPKEGMWSCFQVLLADPKCMVCVP